MAGITAKFDMSEIDRAFRAYIAHSNRSIPYICEKQMVQLCIGAKGVRGLFQEALRERPETIRQIRALPSRLNWRIKRESGPAMAEIRRRVAKAGYFQASGWIIKGLPETERVNRGPSRVFTQRGVLMARPSGLNARITVANTSPRALEFGERTGYIQRAINNRAADMEKYVERKLARDAKALSAKVPRFMSISELMRV